MSTKTLLTLSASVLLGAALAAPNAALAQFGPPPGPPPMLAGPPPGLGAGGPPPGLGASSDDGCYYVSAYRRYGTRRVLVCHED